MNIFYHLIIILFIIFKFNISIANEISCFEFKEIIKNNAAIFYDPPAKDEKNDYGIYFNGYDDVNDFIYREEKKDNTIKESKGAITITKTLSNVANETFELLAHITRINDTIIEDLFSELSIEEASSKINKLLSLDNIEVEGIYYVEDDYKNLSVEKIAPIVLTKHIYEYPTKVWIDFNLDDITYINIKESDYTAKYFYNYEWKDNRFTEYLNKTPNKECEFKYINQKDFLYKSFWQPEIHESNKVENIDTFDEFKYVNILFYIWENEAYVKIKKYNTAIFNNVFHLENFPFDSQSFPFVLYTPEIQNDIILVDSYDQEYVQNNIDYFLEYIEHPEWNYKSIDNYIITEPYADGTNYDEFYFTVNAERKYSYYIFKVIIPVILILMICWSVFWIDGFQLESRLTVTSVSFLALIAYNYVVDEDLPRMGYSTTLDYIILCAYIFAGMATILTIYSYYECNKQNKNYTRVDIIARYLGPLAYLIINLVLVAGGIQGMGTFAALLLG